MDRISHKRSIFRIAKRELAHIRAAMTTGRESSRFNAVFSRSDTETARVWLLVELRDEAASEVRSDRLATGLIALNPSAHTERWPDEMHDSSILSDAAGMAIVLSVGVAPDETLRLTGVERIGERWVSMQGCHLEGEAGSEFWPDGRAPSAPPLPPERVARFTSSFGVEAYQRLRRATVAVIGAGGTGSVAIPTLARAGVGRIVIVDSDHLTPSNLERTQASFPENVAARTLKAELARDHVRRIDPEIEVVAFEGRLPQREVLEAVVEADALIGCTDQHTSRLALSDIARRYLVPAIDCGGLIEGAHGVVTGQIVQLVLFRPDDPCPRCRGMIDAVRVKQELLSDDDREALRTGSLPDAVPPEAHQIPQIDTVGYITTISGTLAAAYTIGWLTGRFDPPFERMQMNLVAQCLDVTDRPQEHDPSCCCRAVRGMGDLAVDRSPFVPPAHWKPARRLT